MEKEKKKAAEERRRHREFLRLVNMDITSRKTIRLTYINESQ